MDATNLTWEDIVATSSGVLGTAKSELGASIWIHTPIQFGVSVCPYCDEDCPYWDEDSE